MNCGKCSSKTIMGFLGLLFFATGLACIVLGSMIIHRYYHNLAINNIREFMVIPSIVLIVVGFVLFFAGISGFCNMCRESKGCLCSFFMFLLLVFILLITAASLSAVYKDDINKQLVQVINDTMKNYNESAKVAEQFDDLQQAIKCCGCINATDWYSTSYGKIPKSCYPNNATTTTKYYDEGCYAKIKSIFDNNLGYIIGGTVGLLVILLLGMIGSCCLIYYKRNEDKYFTLS